MRLSSYSIKWLVIYLLYCLTIYLIGQGNFFNDDVKDAIFQYIAIPLISYLFLPFVLKLIGNWKIVKWIDGAIDYTYRTIKEPSKKHEFKGGTSALSEDISSKKKNYWIWKTLKVLLWVAVIWGILILIHVIPGLGVPAAALAGYVGVKMTKKDRKK